MCHFFWQCNEGNFSRPELPTSKFYCLTCGKICDVAIRPEYEEFKVDDANRLCADCFHKAYQIEVELWRQEQRRNIGPDWEGFPTLKKTAFKKPISLVSSSSSLSAGGGGPGASEIKVDSRKLNCYHPICLLIVGDCLMWQLNRIRDTTKSVISLLISLFQETIPCGNSQTFVFDLSYLIFKYNYRRLQPPAIVKIFICQSPNPDVIFS